MDLEGLTRFFFSEVKVGLYLFSTWFGSLVPCRFSG